MLERCDIVAFLSTSDTTRAKVFFVDPLGLEFESEDPYAVVFSANGTTLRVQKTDKVEPRQGTVLGWHVSDITAAVEELAKAGVCFEVYDGFGQDELGIMTFPGGARVAWFKDPDGNLLSLDQY
ncbi:MAG TPA: VOC family protein [Pyrinomonadaceae bacterium]|jgi:predicted enzyme related to lactoylglutathione lyase